MQVQSERSIEATAGAPSSAIAIAAVPPDAMVALMAATAKIVFPAQEAGEDAQQSARSENAPANSSKSGVSSQGRILAILVTWAQVG